MKKTCSALRGFVLSPSFARFIGEPFFFLMGMRRGAKQEMGSARRILVVKLDEIGDAVMLTPFVRELRAGMPQAWITIVVKPQLKELWDTCPYVDEVIAFYRQAGLSSLRGQLSALSFAGKKLWKKRFDLAIVPRCGPDYYYASYVAYLSGAQTRLGCGSNASRGADFNFDVLYTELLDSGGALRHEVEKNLEFLKPLHANVNTKDPELWLADEDIAFADAAFGAGGRLAISYGIGASSDKRVWPVGNFLELSSRLRKDREVSIIILGGQKERASGEVLKKELGDIVINLAGKTTLRQAAAVLRKCRVYAGNDSGLMHMAAAVGTPVVEISCHPENGSADHYNSPSRFGPWGVRQRVLQPERAIAPCAGACVAEQAHCIENVSVDAVMKAVLELVTD